MKIAVIGCLHGELDIIYDKIKNFEESNNVTIDLVLACGDFQTVRNNNDLKCMAVPPKYQKLGTFYQYYFGEKTASKLTLLIGGNHEASNYLQTLPYGGWVAPNMYYLGYCSVVRFRGLRIGGISGIFKMHDAKYSHYECLPYDNSSLRSIYHMREVDVYKLIQLSNKNESKEQSTKVLDIFMSHDWPINIHTCGNVNYLLKMKPFFREEVNTGRLGNPLLQPLVHHLKPLHWFAAHLHVGFHATIFHDINNESKQKSETSNSENKTQFQALDKVLPRRHFLHIVDVDDQNIQNSELEYDLEWLAILKKTNHLLTVNKEIVKEIDIFNGANRVSITDEDLKSVEQSFNGNLEIPKNFVRCEPVTDLNVDNDPQRTNNYVNSQTTQFCEMLGITDPNTLIISKKPIIPEAVKIQNPDEINLSDSDSDCGEENVTKKTKLNNLFFIDTKGE